MTLLIKNVQIVGGARTFNSGSDIFINNDKISAIGNFSNKRADVVLDGQGAHLSPGFIDSNTDSDHYLTLFDDPRQEDFLRQGVTSILGGMCGASLAPLLYGSLESIQKWGNIDRVNVSWHTMAEFLRAMERSGSGVNFGTLVGHETVRRAIVGESLRDLTKNEMNVFSRVLETALAEGAFGLSTGLGYVHARKTPYAELRALAEIVKRSDGVYATHLRDGTAGIKTSVEETIKLVKETGVSALISHFMPVVGAEREYQEALALIEELPPEIDLRFDMYPSSSSLLAIYTFLPEWVQTGGVNVMLANIHDEWLLPRIKKDLPSIDQDNFIVAQAPGNDFLVGKSLREIKEMYGVKNEQDALVRLMQTLQLRGSILYKNLNMDLIIKAIASSRSLIASNAPSIAEGGGGNGRHFKSVRNTATFSSFLSMTEAHNMMPFADAIRKITLDPAKKFGLVGRGEIKEGNIADMVCFRGGEVKFTMVNGKLMEKEGEFQSTFAGKVLRHPLKK
jgi:N-acyl-D-amino-acid deacylase